jgi:hypothetical protein
MKGSAIKELIERDPLLNFHFEGIFAADCLPEFTSKQSFAIANSDIEGRAGVHWRLLFKPDKNTLEIFDSLGDPLENAFSWSNVSKVLPYVTNVIVSKTQFQPTNSNKCGLYCIYVAYNRLFSLDIAFSTMLSDIFTDNLEENDRIVTEFATTLQNG